MYINKKNFLNFNLQNMSKNNILTFATSFRGDNLTKEEECALDHLLEIMAAVKQQILLRKLLINK